MLRIHLKGNEFWDEESEEFKVVEEVTLDLEHSLVSLSKWESKFEKPFLGAGEKTDDEVLAYIEAMILNEKFPPGVCSRLGQDQLTEIDKYINAKKSATFFSDTIGQRGSREVITSELIYYWMIAFSIPFECQHWHLNRLFTLIRVCNVKNSKPQKRNRSEMIAERRRLNDERRALYKTSG
jgi:hypothetical protein